MSLEDYSIINNSKYVWQYIDGTYIHESVNNYDSLCSIYERGSVEGVNIYFKLSTGEEYYSRNIGDLASDGVGIFCDEFIPKDSEDSNTNFISRNNDFRLFQFSDSIISSGTRNNEFETLEKMLTYFRIYEPTGERTEDGEIIYTLKPNRSSGTIVYMRTWIQVDIDDVNNPTLPPLLPKGLKITDWGKEFYN